MKRKKRKKNDFGSARAYPYHGSNHWSSENESIKLFVDGLDKDVKYAHVRQLFENFGKVCSVFVPRACKRGRQANFGFVVFQNKSEGLVAMRSLHGTRFNTWFLSINPARFIDWKVNKNPLGMKTERRSWCKEWRPKFDVGKNIKKQDIKKVWRVKRKLEPMQEVKAIEEKGDGILMKQLRVGQNNDLPNMICASLCEVLSSEDVLLWISHRGYLGIQVKPFGAKEKILEFNSPEEGKKFLQNMENRAGSIFQSLDLVTPTMVPKSYLVWLKLWKIPIGFWSVDFISKVASTMGNLVCLDADTKQSKRFDVARVLIVANDPILENQLIPVTIDGVNLNILVEIDYIFHENLESLELDGQSAYDEKWPTNEVSSHDKMVVTAETDAFPSEYGSVEAEEMNRQKVVVVSEGGRINGENCNRCAEIIKLKSTDWVVRKKWSWDVGLVGPINFQLNGWGSQDNTQIRLCIPTEGFNLMFFGSSFPIKPFTSPMGLGPLLCHLSDLCKNLLKPAPEGQDAVLSTSGCTLLARESLDFSLSPPAISNPSLQPELVNCSSELEDEAVLKRVKQGMSRAAKLKSLEILELGCAKPGVVKKKRGRKPKSEVGPSMLREISEGSGGIEPSFVELQAAAAKCGTVRHGADKYLTRATKVWLLGKSAGLVFPGSDEEAIRGLAKELEEDQPVFEV